MNFPNASSSPRKVIFIRPMLDPIGVRAEPPGMRKKLWLCNPSETSNAYFVLSNDRDEIWFVCNRHMRTMGLLPYELRLRSTNAPLSKIDSLPGRLARIGLCHAGLLRLQLPRRQHPEGCYLTITIETPNKEINCQRCGEVHKFA